MESSENVKRAALLTIRSWMVGEEDSSFVSQEFHSASLLLLHIGFLIESSCLDDSKHLSRLMSSMTQARADLRRVKINSNSHARNKKFDSS